MLVCISCYLHTNPCEVETAEKTVRIGTIVVDWYLLKKGWVSWVPVKPLLDSLP